MNVTSPYETVSLEGTANETLTPVCRRWARPDRWVWSQGTVSHRAVHECDGGHRRFPLWNALVACCPYVAHDREKRAS